MSSLSSAPMSYSLPSYVKAFPQDPPVLPEFSALYLILIFFD